ncbi:T9SS type A sorting domain-containing protein [Flavobacterium sp. ENC]|uniref:DUF7619 domain-containing protein n=1 Tax=Flavobacterium sp. ENC TaxID=2897330 RepID=UPI001E4833B6|nr:T9SS type A sorting domain-containing protein [Flavobacterium sp. ENC]MCD0465492.1 T9SS type A sorting domain-containing protein [Flavobacterium sp. ENC]
MKKIYFLLLALCFFNGLTAQVITIPDAVFKSILLKADITNTIAKDINGNAIKIDANNNSEIEVSEALNVYSLYTYILLSEGIVKDLSGIEYFSNLKDLNCSGFYSQNLDLSSLKNLEKLVCSETHQMKTLNISGLTKLKYLDTNHCVNLGSLNLSGLTNLEYLNCSQLPITSLNLSGLTKITELRCYKNVLTALDVTGLVNLKKMYCFEGQLTTITLGNLTNLEYLDCRENQYLKTLNVSGLINLQTLYCRSTRLTTLDVSSLTNLKLLDIANTYRLTDINILNCKNLVNFYCSNSLLTNLNVSNLANLTILDCSDSQLTNLNVTGCTALEQLDCGNNKFTTLNLGYLPNLKELDCSANTLLTTLETSNYPNLQTLTCDGSGISTLDVSKSLKLSSLYCQATKLAILDVSHLKELESLGVRDNPLLTHLMIKNGKLYSGYSFLEDKPSHLKYLCVDEENINYYRPIAGKDCEINTYCNFIPGKAYYIVNGVNKFNFDNQGCVRKNSTYPNIKYTITNGTNSGDFYSNKDSFSIPVQEGTVNIRPVLENPGYFTVSPTSANISFPAQSSPFTQDFCISSNGVHQDLEVVLIPLEAARPGFDVKYKLIYRNKGNVTQSGTVNVAFDDAVLDVVLSNPSVSAQALNSLSWNFANLQPFEKREIVFTLNANAPTENPAVNNDDILKFTVTIAVQETDETPADNIFTLNQTVVGSYDPNDKTCLEGSVITPDLIGKYVHYMIRFENTGTYPAQNIVVKDMIDLSKFDISTLVPTSSSHPFETKISKGNKVEFIFENINLPFDDAHNDGYIAFKIKTKPTLVVGDSFTNEANIYFDYNFPILTNKAVSTFKTLGTRDFDFSNYFTVYPVPANDILNINKTQVIEIESLEIYDILGQLVIAVPNAQSVSGIDVSKLRTGNYFIKVKSDLGSSNMKFIKK